MEYKRWRGYCLCGLGGCFPPDAEAVDRPFAPLVLLVDRPAARSRGCFAVRTVDEALQAEGAANLLPAPPAEAPAELREAVAASGATVLNTAFRRAFSYLAAPKKTDGLRLTLVGLGDVGGTLLTVLKLCPRFSELRIYDPNEALCRRYALELNQVLAPDERPLPRVTVCPPEALFDCDLFLFAASRGVPPVGASVRDVRMVQFEQNRAMLDAYALQARNVGFTGLFCQISDPVDHLCRAVFLRSNRDADGAFDAGGLLPEQVRGFGLGVMAARAAYYAQELGIDFSNGRVYGPHGSDLIAANHPRDYDAALSERLTERTVTANLRVRELGFKPYIAPALSSAAMSLLRMLQGAPYHAALPLGGAHFGCVSRLTPQGVLIAREPLHPALFRRIEETYRRLEAFCYD